MDRPTAINTVYEWACQVEQEFGVGTSPGDTDREVREVLNALGVTDQEIDDNDEANRRLALAHPITGYTDAELEATRRPLPAPPMIPPR